MHTPLHPGPHEPLHDRRIIPVLLVIFGFLIFIPLVSAASCTDIQVTSVMRMQNAISVTLLGEHIIDVEEGILIRLQDTAVRVEHIPLDTTRLTIRIRTGTCSIDLPDPQVTDTPENQQALSEEVPLVPDWLFTLRTLLNTSRFILYGLEQTAQESCKKATEAFTAARLIAQNACQGYTRETLATCTDASCLTCKKAYTTLLAAEEARDVACDRVSCPPLETRETHASTYRDPLFDDSACSTPGSTACEEEYARVQSPRCPFLNITLMDPSLQDTQRACGIIKDPSESLFSAFQCQCYPTLETGVQSLLDETENAIRCFSSGGMPEDCLSGLAFNACREATLLFTPSCLANPGERQTDLSGGSDPFIVRLLCTDPLNPLEDLSRFAYKGTASMSLSLICPNGNTSTPCFCPLRTEDPPAEGVFCSPPDACAYGQGCTNPSSSEAPDMPPFLQIRSPTERLEHLPVGVDTVWRPLSVWLKGNEQLIVQAEKRFLGIPTESGILTTNGLVTSVSCSETGSWIFWTREENGLVWLFRARKEQESFSLQEEKIMLKQLSCHNGLPTAVIISLSPPGSSH